MITDKLLKPEEVAPLLRTSRKTLLDWARQNIVPSKPFGRRCVMFLESDINRIMQSGLPQLRPGNNIKAVHRSGTGRNHTSKGVWE